MRLLGIDVGEREVRVARGERVLGVVRNVTVARIPIDEATPVPSVLRALGPGRRTRVLTALPARLATHRMLVLPFADRRRLAETVPLELAGQLAVDVANDAVVAFTPLGPREGGTAVLAVAARREDIAAHRTLLTAAGLVPARIDLAPLPVWSLVPEALGDAALVLADGGRSALSRRTGGRLATLRALGADAADPEALATEARWSLAATGGPPPRVLVAGPDVGPALVAALRSALEADVVALGDAAPLAGVSAADLSACALAAGLVAGEGRGAQAGLALDGTAPSADGSLRRAGALAAAALVLAVVDLVAVRHGLARRDAALAAAVRAEAAAVLPGAPLVAPRAELEAAVTVAERRRGRLGGGTSPLALLRELSTRVPDALRLDLDEMTVDADTVRLHGRAESFDAVDALRRALAGSPLLSDVRADETRTTVGGRQVEFRLQATLRPVAGVHS